MSGMYGEVYDPPSRVITWCYGLRQLTSRVTAKSDCMRWMIVRWDMYTPSCTVYSLIAVRFYCLCLVSFVIPPFSSTGADIIDLPFTYLPLVHLLCLRTLPVQSPSLDAITPFQLCAQKVSLGYNRGDKNGYTPLA
jgi:hypothetical protein